MLYSEHLFIRMQYNKIMYILQLQVMLKNDNFVEV
jgi:hypothetical protein